MRNDDFHQRSENWCKLTGLKKSRKFIGAICKCAIPYMHIDGFDHTQIYYHPASKRHIILTEPYHSTEEALKAFRSLMNGRPFSFAVGGKDNGIWNPVSCFSLIIGFGWEESELQEFAKLLPVDTLQ